jgi:hypothetical protein
MRAFPTTAPSSRLQIARKPCLKAAYHRNSFYSPLANVAERSSRTVRFRLFLYLVGVTNAVRVGSSGSQATN